MRLSDETGLWHLGPSPRTHHQWLTRTCPWISRTYPRISRMYISHGSTVVFHIAVAVFLSLVDLSHRTPFLGRILESVSSVESLSSSSALFRKSHMPVMKLSFLSR